MFALIAAIVIGQATAQAPPPVPDARQLRVAPPQVLAEVDTVKVQGSPVGLAWNAEGTLYLRVTQGKGKDGKDRVRHYQITTQPALSVGQTDQAPAWAASYWTWKSGTVAPGDPTLKIEVEQRSERTRTTNTPGLGAASGSYTGDSGGDRGELGVGASEAAFAALGAIASGVVTMRFKGQVVGEWTHEAPQPGMQYGWAPAPMGVLAYVDANKRLALLGRDGHKVLIPGATNVLLPAWSDDGTRIVYLQKKSAHLYLLMIAGLR